MIFQLCLCHISKIPKTAAVYEISDERRTHRYIGSSVDVHERARDHFFRLVRDKHPNKKLQRFFHKKRGVLFFRPFYFADKLTLKRVEQMYLDRAKPSLNRSLKATGHKSRWL